MNPLVSPEAPSLPWPALFAWAIAFGAVALAWRKRTQIEKLAPPPTSELLRELTTESAELAEQTRAIAVAELNQRLGDVSFELELAPATFAALTRICLASGSGLALFAYVASAELSALDRVVHLALAACAGLIGAVVVASIGRAAKALARQIRENWDAASRDMGKALGASLEGPTERRDTQRNDFPR